MQRVESTFALVGIGTYIVDKKGVTWKVTHANKTHLGMVNRDKDERIINRPSPEHPVTILSHTDEEREAMLRAELGAVDEALMPTGSQVWVAPPWVTMTREDRIAHLQLMHGVAIVGDVSNADLEKAHKTNLEGAGAMPHVHGDWKTRTITNN